MKLNHYWIVGSVALLTAIYTAPANADPVTTNAGANSVSDVTRYWMTPSGPPAEDASAEERLAFSIRMMISGGQRDGHGGSGMYHTQPGEIWQLRGRPGRH